MGEKSDLGGVEKNQEGDQVERNFSGSFNNGQIRDEIVADTEKMIIEIRCKAERFHEFLLQQKLANGGVDI
ncbi:hypothetical protein LIER_41851 [Lithospermum erythrorhizon]|uniref:Uncharacterized protein n=1 Tax=Lithospermum erythrorhizon TaxID=34254 RepID=A0AAV3RJC2_LITER